jgi:hypothetical protein
MGILGIKPTLVYRDRTGRGQNPANMENNLLESQGLMFILFRNYLVL